MRSRSSPAQIYTECKELLKNKQKHEKKTI
jgi:hypothetical protein